MIQDPKKRTSREEETFQILHDVQDAEFDIDIVDMGLIYGVHFDDKKQSVIANDIIRNKTKEIKQLKKEAQDSLLYP